SLLDSSAKSGTRCKTSTGAPRLRIGLAPRLRDRSALKQVERSVGDRPLDVATRSVDLLAAGGELAQLRKLLVVETQALHELGGQLFLDRPAPGNSAHGDLLVASLALEHAARPVDAVVVG